MTPEYVKREAATQAAVRAVWLGQTSAGQIAKAINDVPTADVVEVTRCKDCRHHSAAAGVCNLYLHFSVGVTANDYCSFGERKTT